MQNQPAAQEPQHEKGWKIIEHYILQAIPYEQESHEEIKTVLQENPALHGTCAKYMAGNLKDMFTGDLWLLEECLLYCLKNDRSTIEDLEKAHTKEAIKSVIEKLERECFYSDEKEAVDSLHACFTAIFTQDAPQEEAAATVTTPNTIRTLIKQASYGKISYPKK
jgi:hypothetical protein